MSDESYNPSGNSEPLRCKNHDKRKISVRWLERLSEILLREPKDRDQLIALLYDAEERQLLDREALRMIEGVIRISEFQVRDIMIPRSQMVVVEHNALPETFLPLIIESAHSRFPIIGESRDEVVGILLAKDLLRYNWDDKNQPFNFSEILRPAMFVPQSKRLNALLREFRQNYTHMAIVVDEYGGVSGLVTIEDILEKIVGNIEDEYDTEEEDANIKKQNETLYIVKAATHIHEFNEQFDAKLSEEEFDTIGGLVTNLFGHLPAVSETITYDNFEFKVLSTDARRVNLLQVKIIAQP